MNHHIKNWIIALCIWFLSIGAANAITISFSPSSQSVVVGAMVDVGVEISELGSGVTPSLSTFDLDVSYNPGLLSLNSVSFGDSSLGDQLDVLGLGSLTSYDDSISGLINLFELSLDTASDLETLQVDSFTLATMSFNTIGIGNSPLDIVINSLGDAEGNPLTATINPGTVSVIPLPPALPLLGSGLVALILMGRERKKSHSLW
ncbi:MAG: cohesin domain-containing protein [Candidatus Thiodiazotropha lotti]|nr:cohesin domain-containing protein [Candidatus Thiodiazotropha lotti]MCW4222414.1 cohesin domain-containing protein [Candidatus Thiodiazotropha lotti]